MSYRLTVDVIGDKELARAFKEARGITTKELSKAIGRKQLYTNPFAIYKK